MESKGADKKLSRKRGKALSVVSKSECMPLSQLLSPTPTSHSLLLHYSNGDEEAYKCVERKLEQYGGVERLVFATGLGYGFVEFGSEEQARSACEAVNRPEVTLPFSPKPHPISLLYTPLSYSQFSFAGEECLDSVPVPGLSVLTDFLTPAEEANLIERLDSGQWTTLTNRRVQHFGYDFVYGANKVDSEADSALIPDWLHPLLDKIEHQSYTRFDQITANDYLPGDSIPPHTDSHSPFEELLVVVSLGSGLGMLFARGSEKFNMWLPAKSLLAMTGEARYVWKHAILQRRFDVYRGRQVFRRRRLSLTFRKIRRKPCECRFEDVCDRTEKPRIALPGDVQKRFVQETYDKIAEHFSHTRYRPWPAVSAYLQSLPEGAFTLDVGCGNGKYLAENSTCWVLGTDRSAGLLQIAANRGFPVFLADSLQLPVRSSAFDALISIAVIHHFSTTDMRLQAVNELLRVLKPSGSALIYVWAMEQSERTFESQDVFVPWHLQQCYEDGEPVGGVVEEEKSAVVYQRFYHVFVKGELEALVSAAKCGDWRFQIEKSYYDHSNWCVVCTKSLRR